MATSRDNTTTGRRLISGSSHHHTSPRAGRTPALTIRRPPRGTMRDRPRHQAR
jgi:hypothetical protein